MKYEELTEWDLDLIKSNAKTILVDENICVTGAMVKSIMSAMHAMGYNIVKDETREATWTHGPKKSWYAQHSKKKW
jgi:hypothetical protein